MGTIQCLLKQLEDSSEHIGVCRHEGLLEQEGMYYSMWMDQQKKREVNTSSNNASDDAEESDSGNQSEESSKSGNQSESSQTVQGTDKSSATVDT